LYKKNGTVKLNRENLNNNEKNIKSGTVGPIRNRIWPTSNSVREATNPNRNNKAKTKQTKS